MFESLFSRSGLSLERLRSFLEMAEAGSIAGAAPGDPVRQSQISRQIRELEDYFGAELTVRRGKTLALTPEGRRLADLVREQFGMLDDFRRERAGAPRVFVVAAGVSTLEWLVVPALPRLADLLGGARLRTELRRSRSLVEGVREGRVDLGLVRRDAVPDAEPGNCEPVTTVSFHLCVPRHFLPAGAGAEGLDDPAHWRELPFAAGGEGGQMARAVRDAMTWLEVDFEPRFDCGSMLHVLELVRREACAAVLPNLALGGLDEERILVAPFRAMADYGRRLVLHWNPRQMGRREVDDAVLRGAAQVVAEGVGEQSTTG